MRDCPISFRRVRTKEDGENLKKPENSDAFFQRGTQTLNSCCNLDKSIISFNDLCKPIEIYINARKKHTFTCYPVSKHPKHSKFANTDIREKPVDLLLLYDTGVDFSSRDDFANLGSFAKVSILVETILPC